MTKSLHKTAVRGLIRGLVGVRIALLARLILTLLVLGWSGPLLAADNSGTGTGSGGTSGALARWWNGKKVSNDWFGARTAIEDRGLTLYGDWRGIYFGILDSEKGSGNAFAQQLNFGARLDFAKLMRAEVLNGLAAFGEVRWRDPGYNSNPANIVESSNLFNPSRYSSGTGWRLLTFGLQYKAPEFLGVKDGLTATGGWLRPQKEFIDQPLANLFANNAMAVAKGLGGNIPFSAGFSTWGGTLEVKPVTWQYTKAGLFMSYPEATFSSNNGLMFQGYAPDPSQNGLFFMGETGVTPKIGASKLPGRYAFGTYFYQEDNPQFGTSKYGFYWQADQMLYREPSAAADKLSDQGLSLFSLVTFAPNGYNNNYPFYFQGGLVYEGLVPRRDRDQLIFGLASGEYSERSIQAAQRRKRPVPSNTTFLEAGYRIKVNGWSFVQPFAQYIVQPNGTTAVANATILGLFMGIDF